MAPRRHRPRPRGQEQATILNGQPRAPYELNPRRTWPDRRRSANFVGEAVPGGLPGYAEGDRDPIPAPPAGPGGSYPLGHQGFVPADLVRGLSDGAQVRQIINRGGRWVELVGQPLEAAGSVLDLGVGVSHGVTTG